MREDHHTFEPHTEGASDHFCDRCFGSHHWQQDCPADEEEEDEMIDFERITETQQLRVEIGGAETIHTVTAWKVPRDATEAQVKEAMNYWIEATFCQHEHDCCGNYYGGRPELLGGRTYYDRDTEIVFVLQTHTLNV
jgi:hypothetical protein